MLKIRILNEVTSMVVAGDKKLLLPCLSYDDFIYRKVKNEEKGYRENKRCEYRRFMVDRYGVFLTGFIPRIKNYCSQTRIPLEIIPLESRLSMVPSKEYWHQAEEDLKIAGWILKEHQVTLLREMFKNKRGVLHSPTASGKTVIFTAFLRGLPPDARALILTPGTDLIEQTVEKLVKVFPKEEVGIVTGDIIEPSRITVSNIQKFHRLPASTFHDNLDVVIADECHHVGDVAGTWAKAFSRCTNAPYRFGFTATLPYDQKAIMALEGLIGPVIGKIEMGELIKDFVLAQPFLKLIKIPYQHKIHELSNYDEVYLTGVVDNRIRNRIILEEVVKLADKGLTSLIMVKNVEHGERLEEMARKRFPNLRIRYIYGASSNEVREQTKNELETKSLDAVIASVVWKEGIDIVSLGAVINAAGGKADIFPQQAFGRGLRITTGKTHVYLYDFFDSSHPYLIDHFGHRLCLYIDLGFLGDTNAIQRP